MTHITFHLDFLSPFAYLAFEQLPEALAGISHSVRYRPVLLAALLRHHGTRGPAEVPGKREWTYRHALWLGHAAGIPMQMPAVHPYNPLPHLRLALASSEGADINRHVAETIFRAVWRGGADAIAPERLADLAARLPQLRDAQSEAVKAQLRANTEAAAAAGVFGTPAFETDDGKVFWGFDSLPMLRAYLQGDGWFDAHWSAAGHIANGLRPSAP